jgi:hypothetical protein
MFTEEWKNFDPIGDHKIVSTTTKTEFLSYLTLWRKRADAQGAREVDGRSQSLLGPMAYAVHAETSVILDMITIVFGPTRVTTRGGNWGDSVSFVFYTPLQAEALHQPVGQLESFSVFCDAFNSRGR